MSFLCQVHVGKIIICFKQFIDGIADKFCLLFERADSLGQDQKNAKLLTVDIVFKFAKDPDNGISNSFEVSLELGCYRSQDGFEGAELVGKSPDPWCVHLPELGL